MDESWSHVSIDGKKQDYEVVQYDMVLNVIYNDQTVHQLSRCAQSVVDDSIAALKQNFSAR